MKCKEIQDLYIAYLSEEVIAEEKLIIEEHIASCKTCAQELAETKQFLGLISDVKEELPSNNLKKRFEAVLTEEIQKEVTKVIPLQSKTDWSTYIRIAASIVIVIGAFLIGRESNKVSPNVQEETAILALLENQSASKRIMAVAKTEQFTETDTKIIDALIQKLFNDKNVNVRLAAAEALTRFSSLEKVRGALIKALETEKQPTLQIELIQILAKIQEKKALEPMKKLLEKEETPNYVKQELRYNIANLL